MLEFSVPPNVVRARLYIAGLGYYICFINGQRVSDKVLGTFTTFEKRVLYDTYDVTYLLQTRSALAVMLGHGTLALRFPIPSCSLRYARVVCTVVSQCRTPVATRSTAYRDCRQQPGNDIVRYYLEVHPRTHHYGRHLSWRNLRRTDGNTCVTFPVIVVTLSNLFLL